MKIRTIGILVIVLIALGGIYVATKRSSAPSAPSIQVTNTAQPEVAVPTPPAPTPTPLRPMSLLKPSIIINKTKIYTALVKTDAGDITIALDAAHTPITVNNFVYLAQHHFYDGVIFHRVIKGFMIQGGDPTGTGSGGPGYQFNDERFTGEYTRGTVAMANAGPNTNGSQFFIMHADVPLPKNYVIFGHVTAGMDAVDAIATASTIAGGESSTPVTPVVIRSATIIEK